jgi:succinate dehydrogenase/fumarate reductase cytochrome b subunit
VGPAALAKGSTSRSLERWFEVTSVLPLAGFVLIHLASYGRAALGVTEIGVRHGPSAVALVGEVLGVWLPFGFHAAYALPLWRRRRREAEPASAQAWLALHRLTGGVLGLFLVDHFLRFRLPILRGDRYPAESVEVLARELSRTVAGIPLVAGLHALGTLALSFHLGYGLWRVAERHVSPAAAGRARVACLVIGGLFGAVGTLTVVRLAAG